MQPKANKHISEHPWCVPMRIELIQQHFSFVTLKDRINPIQSPKFPISFLMQLCTLKIDKTCVQNLIKFSWFAWWS